MDKKVIELISTQMDELEHRLSKQCESEDKLDSVLELCELCVAKTLLQMHERIREKPDMSTASPQSVHAVAEILESLIRIRDWG